MAPEINEHLRMYDNQYWYRGILVMITCYLIVSANHRSIALERLLVSIGREVNWNAVINLSCQKSPAEGNYLWRTVLFAFVDR